MATNYTVEDIYQGGYSGLDPNTGSLFTGYRTNTGSIGLSTDPRTANILKEVSEKIAPGQKAIELSLIQGEIFDSIPKQHLEEIKRLSKLTNVDITVHGPLIDASGATQQGFDDQQREIAEKKIFHALERSHDINPDGNIPVTFHTANQLPGARWRKISEEERKKRGIKETEEMEIMPIVNQESGQFNQVKRDVKYYPGHKEIKEEHSVDRQLEIINSSEWANSIQHVVERKEFADRIFREIEQSAPVFQAIREKKDSGEKLIPEEKQIYEEVRSRMFNADDQLSDVHSQLSALFNKAYKYGTDEEKTYLKSASDNFRKRLSEVKSSSEQSKAMQGLIEDLDRVDSRDTRNVKKMLNPQLFKSAEGYALEKSHETFGNVAWQAYKKFGSTAPIISIENPPAGMGLSRGRDVKNMVEGSRKQFVENAVKEGKLSENQAKQEAEKLIGVTWDVGHINQLRQFGFSGKDIVGEAKEVAPLVKHIHLSDNFGMENTELPMGMGNVDLKEVMATLGKKGEDAKKIVEAAAWWQHQQTSPIGPTFEALGTPMYLAGAGGGEQPYWNQVTGLQPGYFGGYGQTFPQINYETFGAGFSNLPSELGGQGPGAQGGRMSGRGME